MVSCWVGWMVVLVMGVLKIVCVVVKLGSTFGSLLLVGRYVGGLEGGNRMSLWGFVGVIAYDMMQLLCIVFQMESSLMCPSDWLLCRRRRLCGYQFSLGWLGLGYLSW